MEIPSGSIVSGPSGSIVSGPSGSIVSGPSGSVGPSTPTELPESTLMKNSLLETQKLLSQIRAIINPFFAETSETVVVKREVKFTSGTRAGQIKTPAVIQVNKIPAKFTTMIESIGTMNESMKTMNESMERLAAAKTNDTGTNDTGENNEQEGGRRKRRKTLHKRRPSRGSRRR